MRLKSVKNIQKITQSMKMVSAAKYARAERDLKLPDPMEMEPNLFIKEQGLARNPLRPQPLGQLPKSFSLLYPLIVVFAEVFIPIFAKLSVTNCKPGTTLTMLVLSALETSPVPNFPDCLPRTFCVLEAKSAVFHLSLEMLQKIATNILNSGFEYDSGKM